jgi:citronellol/citronellal dehydrogenase
MMAGPEAYKHCRTPDIMGDAAHAILTRPSAECTGRYFIDDEALAQAGVTDFEQYSDEPGAELFADLLVDDTGGFNIRQMPLR